MAPGGLWSELRRRNVFKVATAYLVLSWLLMQVASILFPALHLPDWSVTLLVALLAIGLVPVLIFSWVYELTPEGLKRESEIDPARSITGETGQKLNLITIGLLAIAICVVIIDRLLLDQPQPATQEVVTEPYAEPALPAPTTEAEAVPFLAVLPFKATGSDDGGFLAGGLHDDLLIRLAKLGAFKVISRTSMMEYKETTKNMRQIGEELGAGYILEGSVQSLNNRVHINAQLIDAREDEHLWADSYDRELTATNLFEIQAELAEAIARELRATLSESAKALIAEPATKNTLAYTAYLRGLEYIDKPYTLENQSAMEAAFEEAVRLDPEFAIAWVRLSRTHIRAAFYSTDADKREHIREAALGELERARALRPGLLESEIAWAEYLEMTRRFEEALHVLESIDRHAESNAEYMLIKATVYDSVGRYEEAYRALLNAHRLSPRSSYIAKKLVLQAIYNNDCESAGWYSQAALSMAPEDADILAVTAKYHLYCTGDVDEATRLITGVNLDSGFRLDIARDAARASRDYKRLLELAQIPLSGRHSSNRAWDILDETFALQQLGNQTEADAALARAAKILAEMEQTADSAEDYLLPLWKARYHSLKGDKELVLHLIEEDEKRYREEDRIRYAWQQQVARVVRAVCLADVGLHDEAIAELRKMFAAPGSPTFVYIDSMPFSDTLKGQPKYEELRRGYGGVKNTLSE